MCEISLLDIREFIAAAKLFGLNFSEHSVMLLRLVIRRLCVDMKILNFAEFMRVFMQSSEIRYTVKVKAFCHPGELMRDAADWKRVLSDNRQILENPDKRILIYDNCFDYDITNFLIHAAMLDISIRSKVYWYSDLSERSVQSSFQFKEKEILTGNSNLGSIQTPFESHFSRTGDSYWFTSQTPIERTTFDHTKKYFPMTEQFDFLISQNNSLVCNFKGQDAFLAACYSRVLPGGRLYFGLKENVSVWRQLHGLQQPVPQIKYFIKNDG